MRKIEITYPTAFASAARTGGARVLAMFHWALPSRYHSIHKNDLARAMVAQSEQAYLALAQGKGPTTPAVKILEYKEMELFFAPRR